MGNEGILKPNNLEVKKGKWTPLGGSGGYNHQVKVGIPSRAQEMYQVVMLLHLQRPCGNERPLGSFTWGEYTEGGCGKVE